MAEFDGGILLMVGAALAGLLGLSWLLSNKTTIPIVDKVPSQQPWPEPVPKSPYYQTVQGAYTGKKSCGCGK